MCDNDDTVVVHDGDYDDEMEDDDYLACEKNTPAVHLDAFEDGP